MSAPTPRIVILMPTFNSAKFLAEQVESLLAQTNQDFVIVTRDDGSTDDSLALIEAYADAHPGRFHVMPGDGTRRGASGTFACLLRYVLEHKPMLRLQDFHVMFCDHDDVWYPHKIAVTLARMQALEAAHPGLPALVHSDLNVVDVQRRQIAPSFVRFQGIVPHRNNFFRMLVRNTVTGCTVMINERLAAQMLPIPQDAIMHDWWMALVASAFGRIEYIDEPLLDYRQHNANTLGAREYKQSERPSLLGRVLDRQRVAAYREMARQAEAFNLQYKASLSTSRQLTLRLFSALVKLLR